MATRRKRAVSDKATKAQRTPSFQPLGASASASAGPRAHELFAIETEWLRLCDAPTRARKTG